MSIPPDSLSPEEAYRFLETLFPAGLQCEDLHRELCPEGWEASVLRLTFHPSLEQRYEEYVSQTRHYNKLFGGLAKRRDEDYEETSIVSFEEFCRKDEDEKGKEILTDSEEITELLGLCLWDIFSDNHDVIGPDGRVVDIGSFRGAAGTISDFIERLGWDDDTDAWDRGYGYLDFYMGTIYVSGRTSLVPVYELIFKRIKSIGGTWRYAFPRIHLFSFDKPPPAETDYSPSKALAQQEEDKKHESELKKAREQLDKDTLVSKRRARSEKPPETVAAFQNIFQRFPEGWPPDPYTAA